MRLLVLLALAVVACMADDEMPCTIHHEGRYYDLNPLKSNQDYEFRTPEDHLFAINVCRRPTRETFGLKDVDDAKIGGFVRLDHRDFSIGAVNTTLSIHDSNPRITLTGGSYCDLKSGGSELRASTVVEFVCDTAVFGTGEPRLVAQFPPGRDEDACGYFIQWRTHIACPTNEPGSAWGFFAFFIFTLISLALLYLVAGTLYNRFVLRLRGLDQIPRFSLESMRYHASEAIDWFKDLAGIASNQYNYRMPEEGLETPFPVSGSSSVFPRSAQGTGGLNPVSHHTQVSSPPPAESASVGGFVRPTPSRTTSATTPHARKKSEINPISHQAQASAPASPPFANPPQQHQPQPQAWSPPPAAEHVPGPVSKDKPRPQPFDLGDDDDDDLGMGSATSAVVPRQEGPTAAEERGRDLGEGKGTVRL